MRLMTNAQSVHNSCSKVAYIFYARLCIRPEEGTPFGFACSNREMLQLLLHSSRARIGEICSNGRMLVPFERMKLFKMVSEREVAFIINDYGLVELVCSTKWTLERNFRVSTLFCSEFFRY